MSSLKSEKLEQLKKKPAKRPDWNDLMKEIGQFKAGSRGLLKKTISNDRSKPMLSKHKVKGVVSILTHPGDVTGFFVKTICFSLCMNLRNIPKMLTS